MLPPERRIKKTDFELLKKSTSNSKKFFSSKYFTLKKYLGNFRPSRFAVVVSSAVFKKAVDRNKIKRRVRGIILENLKEFKDSFALIIYVKKHDAKVAYKDLKNDLLEFFKKSNILK